MLIDRFDNPSDLDALHDDWTTAYVSDPSANIFLHWGWIRSWFDIAPHPSFVLAARPTVDAPYSAFLPLATRSIRIRNVDLIRELQMGGKPFAPFSGFVAVPQHEDAAIEAFARYVRNEVHWERFNLAEVMDPRFESFVRHLDGQGISVTVRDPLSCPFVPLPDSWETYLQTFMSKKGRFNLRRSMRQLEELDGYRLTSLETDPMPDQLDVLLTLWETRWGTMSEASRREYHHMYGRAHERGGLWMKLIWHGDRPVAGLAALLDPVKKTTAYYTSGFDAAYARLSPGKAIVGYAIQDAIAQGHHTFDFLVGRHDYKVSFFGAEERFAQNAAGLRSSVRQRVGGLLLRSRDLLRSTRSR